ncbi:MAG: ABC transporter ATP-binding protein [Dehalococcoidia bacterium]|jgi:branched-chain amino acid transport system ATP-binding protein|uniref:ABC transporter ATP-binding protein n=1 Tax=Candidatus Amarobacter glycogenicus TaxID=3140699 RepID=UPI001DB4071E|nr:ABC transporter ATP-binding protein [Dehalococcoidia bacterium]MBK6560855.1 ABC transporter ATP-binding protein [Dehalococcoidia bacterium]MBK7125568.1 ABC transporter ATP-binding protein [Dehalococcoidia bacterium]MBK7330527.1 ABC transporter ATP-binding protein [Dehalococcoidia bacterium]MBK7726497.1 ABC transporter ATP-binding protein [Dehalococcoidia bacterium]
MPLLEVSGLAAGYGAIAAIKGISLVVEDGEIVTLIGSNGAGKSTTLRAVSGIIRPRAGQVTFRGKSIDRLPPHKIVQLGMSHVPEGRGIFHRMTVHENLLLGAYQRNDDLSGDLDRVYGLFPRLKERLGQPGGTLSGGEQQMLAIGRALMARPTLLLLDEPSMGLSPLLVETIFATIAQIRQQGSTVLLVEQNALMALEIADRAYVLESGVITLQGTGAELANNDAVRRSYLGEE